LLSRSSRRAEAAELGPLGGQNIVSNTLAPETPDSPFQGRRYYSLDAATAADVSRAIPSSARTFVLFLAWNATNESDETIRALARDTFAKGLAYLVAWGPDCSRVHDLFDFTGIDEGYYPSEDSVVMTTWHEDESLASALWFFLFNTVPDQAFETTCNTAIAVAVANAEWADTIQRYLRNPAELNRAAGV